MVDLLPSSILLAGATTDLWRRKVPNALVIVGFTVTFAWVGWNKGLPGLTMGFLGCLAALAFHLPLVMTRVLGAGDMKLMMVFGLATHWQTVLTVAVWALLWGAVFGLLRAMLSGHLIALLKNTLALASRNKPAATQLNYIPYTIALCFGWLTHLSFSWGGAM